MNMDSIPTKQVGASAQHVRGYWLALSAEFVRHHFEPAQRERMEGAFSAPLRKALAGLAFGDWVPREHQVELFRAIVAASANEAEALTRLSACGEFVERRAVNKVSGLLFGILTPTLLLKKLPRFWERDHGHGRCQVEPSATGASATILLSDIAGYDHVGAVWLGWLRAALGSAGAREVRASQRGWSPASPAPERISYEVSWS